MFLERLIAQRRSSYRDPSEELLELLTGGKTASGEYISARSALGLSAYFAGLRAISEDTAKLPLPVLRRKKPRGRERQLNHRVDYLLNVQTNPETSAQSFRETIVQHALGWGDGFGEIELSNSNGIEAIWIREPGLVEMFRTVNRELFYKVRTDTRSPRRNVSADRMLHIHGLGPEGLTGYSIARLARETLGEVKAAGKAGASFFANNSRPGGVIEFDVGIGAKDPKALREEFEAGYKGADNFNRVAVLPYPLKFKPVAIPNADAQWIEGRQFGIEETARWFRMPPHKLQHLLRATFSNITEQNIEYVTDCLGAWMRRIELEVQRKLLGATNRNLYVEHNIAALLRGNPKARNESYAIGRQWGWLSANDVREKENENPLPGKQGDIYLVPSNMVDADKIANPPEPVVPVVPTGESEPEIESEAAKIATAERAHEIAAMSRGVVDRGLIERMVDAHGPLFADTYSRLLRFEVDRLRRKDDEFDYAAHGNRATEMLSQCVKASIASVGSLVAGGIESDGSDFARNLADMHIKQSQELLTRTSGASRESVLKKWTNGRANTQALAIREELVAHIVSLVEARGGRIAA